METMETMETVYESFSTRYCIPEGSHNFSFWNVSSDTFVEIVRPYFTWNGVVANDNEWDSVKNVVHGVFTRLCDSLNRVKESLENATNISPKTIYSVWKVLLEKPLFVKFYTANGLMTQKKLYGALKNVLNMHWKTRLSYLLDFEKCFLLSDTSMKPTGLDKQVISKAIRNACDVVDDVVEYMANTLDPQPVRDANGFDENGVDEYGYDEYGFNSKGLTRFGYHYTNYVNGYDKYGYDVDGYDENGYYFDGFNDDGYSHTGRKKDEYDENGYDIDGYTAYGYDSVYYS